MALLSDLILKDFSLFAAPPGLPTGWDLSRHSVKLGNTMAPWEHVARVSFLFPTRIVIKHEPGVATVTAVTMSVRTDADNAFDLPNYIDPDPANVAAILAKHPSAVSVVHSRLLTQGWPALTRSHPVLLQLENLFALSGLMARVLDDVDRRMFDERRRVPRVTRCPLPAEVPTLSRGSSGLGYSLFMWGGIQASVADPDPWTEAVRAKNPTYVREAALRSRPGPAAVSWVIPLGLGRPEDWSPVALRAVRTAEAARLRHALETMPPETRDPATCDAMAAFLAKRRVPQASNPEWAPSTRGEHLAALNASAYFSTGGYEAWRPDGKFSVTGASITAGVPITARVVLANRLEFELVTPLVIKASIDDRPSGLPGITDSEAGYAVGVESPVFRNRVRLASGVVDGRWRLPMVNLTTSLVIPWSHVALDEGFSGTFGSDAIRGSHGVEAWFPAANEISVGTSIDYRTDWTGSLAGDRIEPAAVLLWTPERETGVTLGAHYRTGFSRVAPPPESMAPDRWTHDGHQILASLSFATGGGENSFLVGVFLPTDPDRGRTLILSLDLSGAAARIRRWF